jgi:hypothetical protein
MKYDMRVEVSLHKKVGMESGRNDREMEMV